MSQRPAQFIHHPAANAEARTYAAVGDSYTLLARGEDTGGAYCLIDALIPPGGGPPLHRHTREDEAFYVLNGEVTFTVEGRGTVVAGPGTFLQAPRGIPHAFKNNSTAPARMLFYCFPAGFDRYLREFAVELPSRDATPPPVTPADIEKLVALAPKYGIEVLPPTHN